MNEKTKCYYKELPENYVSNFVVDANNKKIGWTARIMTLVLIGVTFVICEAINGFDFSFKFELVRTILTPIVFFVVYIVMIILHELIHGLFNIVFSHEKLTFGVGKGNAYCGVPDIYMKKGPKMVVAMAPFFTLFIVIVIPLIFIKDPYYYMLASILLSLHVGGCSGDLMEFFILLFKYYGKKVLVNDTGPKQTIYIEQ